MANYRIVRQTVACPLCHVNATEMCVTNTGHPMLRSVHSARTDAFYAADAAGREAARTMTERLSRETADLAIPKIPVTRQVTPVAEVLSGTERLNKLLGRK